MVQTHASTLTLRSCPNFALVDKCILYSVPRLIKNPTCVLMGRECKMHRSIGFFSDDSEGYAFSGQIMHAQPLANTPLYGMVCMINEMYRARYNAVLVNFYETGHDYISAHSDNEAFLDPASGVVACSVCDVSPWNENGIRRRIAEGHCIGCVSCPEEDLRTFRIRKKTASKGAHPIIRQGDACWVAPPSYPHREIKTTPYELIKMGGDFQKEFQHEIPPSKRKGGWRISFTFRYHQQ